MLKEIIPLGNLIIHKIRKCSHKVIRFHRINPIINDIDSVFKLILFIKLEIITTIIYSYCQSWAKFNIVKNEILFYVIYLTVFKFRLMVSPNHSKNSLICCKFVKKILLELKCGNV